MDKRYAQLLKDYRAARRAYLQAKIRLLEHLLKTRRARMARGPRPIDLPGYDEG